MKKLLEILILTILLAVPLSASAGYIGTYLMDVDASPNVHYNWYADYDATITVGQEVSPSYEVFCVENATMDGGNVYYDFYTIDDGLLPLITEAGKIYDSTYAQKILDDLEKSTWYAHWFETSLGSEDDKEDAQTAIWKTMFGNTVGDPSNTTLFNAFNGAGAPDQYVDQWLLAVNPSNRGQSIAWGEMGQNYLVPISAVPEPANMFLMGTGLLGLATLGRRKFFKK